MRGWHWWVACLGITAFSIASIGSALSVGTVGLQYLHYDEVLHFYIENGIPYVNQPGAARAKRWRNDHRRIRHLPGF